MSVLQHTEVTKLEFAPALLVSNITSALPEGASAMAHTGIPDSGGMVQIAVTPPVIEKPKEADAEAISSDTSVDTHTSIPLPASALPPPLVLPPSSVPLVSAPALAPVQAVRQPHMALNQQTNAAAKAHASHLRALAQLGVVPASGDITLASAADAAAAAAADRRSERQRHRKNQDEELANAASALMEVRSQYPVDARLVTQHC